MLSHWVTKQVGKVQEKNKIISKGIHFWTIENRILHGITNKIRKAIQVQFYLDLSESLYTARAKLLKLSET